MSMFKTAGSLLLVCDDALLAQLGGEEVAAALAGQAKGEAVFSIHVATDGEVDVAVQEAARAGGVIVKPPSPTPLGGSYAFFADPTDTSGRSFTTPCTGSGPTGDPRSPRLGAFDSTWLGGAAPLTRRILSALGAARRTAPEPTAPHP